jgi:hypothetical protein
MSAWADRSRPGAGAPHVIEAAIFELSFDNGMADWADERELARIVESQLMSVVNDVFDESASTGGAVRIDSLEVNLGSLRFDGSWTSARERLRAGLRSALARARLFPAAGKSDRLRAAPAESSASAEFGIVAHFLRLGVLPPHTRVRDGGSMDALLRDTARAEPQRLAALIQGQSVGGVVTTRLARQFPDPVLGQVARALSPGHGAVMVGLLRRLKQAVARIGSGALWEGEMRRSLWSRLLRDLAAGSPPAVAVMARRALEDAARGLGRPYRELVVQLSGQVAGSGELAALIRRWALDAGARPKQSVDEEADRAEPVASSTDDLLVELEHRQPEALGWVLDKLRLGDLSLATLTDELSTAGHHRLLGGILVASAQGAGDASELRKAVESYARRAGSEQAFYRQVLERLVGDELIDLEAIAAGSAPSHEQAAPREALVQSTAQDAEAQTHPAGAGGRNDEARPPSGQADVQDRRQAEAQAEQGPPAQGASERLFRAYDLYAQLAERLGGTASTAGQEPGRLAGVIDELARAHPDQLRRVFLELRSGMLRLSQAPRLSAAELRRLVHAFLSLSVQSADADRSQLARAIEEHARRAGSERAFYRQVLERLVGDELIDLEAIAAGSAPSHEQAAPREALVQSAARDAGAQMPIAEGAGPESSEAERALRAWLREGAVLPGGGRESLRRVSEHLLALAPKRFGGLLRRSLQDKDAVARLVGLLPERLLTRALFLLAPAVYERVQRYADAMSNACHSPEIGVGAERIAGLKWQSCFQYLLAPGRDPDAAVFVQRFTDYLAAQSERLEADELRAIMRRRLAETNVRGGGDAGLRAAQILACEGVTDEAVDTETAPETPRLPDRMRDREVLEQGIRIANAGQVLAAPYLLRLFGMLGLVEGAAFKSPAARERAVHLLQFMVDGSTDTPEYELVLNKVLCGLDTAMPVTRGIAIADSEKEAIEGLLRGMIQHWQVLGSTSVSGLRESFLQREGTLRHKSDGWHLSVEPKAFDMLLDRVPWGFSTIKHSWMEEVIYVIWR